jgi:hypothetical protein
MLALLSAVGPVDAQVVLPSPQGTMFPLMMYEATPADARNLTPYGWNVLQSYGLNTTSDINNYMQGLATNKVTGVAVIPATLTTNALNTNSTYYAEWSQAQAQSWVQGLVANTNLAWWSLPEEMRSWMPTELQLLGDYTSWTRANDPQQRPTFEYTPNNRAASEISHIVPTVDVIGLSCYCEFIGMPHAWVRYKVQEAGLHGIALAGKTAGNDYLAGQKTPVAVLYCAKAAGVNSPTNMPTPSQTYHDFWSAIASGARGISVFAYWHGLHDDPSLTNNLQQLNLAASQITGSEKLGDVVLFGAPNTNVTVSIISGPSQTVSFQPPNETNSFQYPSVNVLCKTWARNVYVIAVNSTDQPVTATISNLPSVAASAALPFESRSVTMTNGGLADTLPPWGVHIYKLPGGLLLGGFTALGGGQFQFAVTNSGVASFTLLVSTNLSAWSVLGSATRSVSGFYQFTDPLAAQTQTRFYRARWP